MFVPILYTTAVHSAIRSTNGKTYDFRVNIKTIRASTIAITTYSGACASASALVSYIIVETPLINIFLFIHLRMDFIASIVDSEAPPCVN